MSSIVKCNETKHHPFCKHITVGFPPTFYLAMGKYTWTIYIKEFKVHGHFTGWKVCKE